MVSKRVCTVDGCDRPRPYRLYCTKHYQQVKKYGCVQQTKKKYKWCTVPGCELRANRTGAGLCEKHYMRLRRNGTFESIQKRVPDAECKADGCHARAFRVDGFCRNCGLRFDRNGVLDRHVGVLHPNWNSFDSVGYSTVHQRIRNWMGSARNYQCVDCNKKAAHWSYNHRSPFEKEQVVEGYLVRYSPLLCDYEPRCVKCHKRFDLSVKGFSWGKALPEKCAA